MAMARKVIETTNVFRVSPYMFYQWGVVATLSKPWPYAAIRRSPKLSKGDYGISHGMMLSLFQIGLQRIYT